MNVSFLKRKKIDQIIWLGAGDLAKAELAFSPKTKVHLVDANEAIIERLRKRFKDNQKVNIHTDLIAHHDKQIDFNHYSLQEFNGIAKPTGLKQRYPGLKKIESTNKQATAITDFITSINVAPNESNTIILDLPGLSATLIQALIHNQALHLFNQLVVLSNQEQLFHDDLPTSELVNLLEQNGFLCQIHPSSYQDYTIIQAQLNPLYNELAATKNHLVNAQSEVKSNQALLIKAQKASEELSKEKHSSDQLLADAVKQKEQQQIEYQNQVEKLKKDKQELFVQIEAFSSQDEKSQQTQAELNAKLKQYIEQIEKYKLEREEFNKKIDQLTQQNIQLQENIQKIDATLNKLSQGFEGIESLLG